MRAAVVHEFLAPVAIEDVSLEDPRAGEVVVKIAASGVCRSDLHLWHGRSPVANLPMVLGHEGAGVVEAVGPGVRSVAPGDHVVIGLYAACGECAGCRSGAVERCDGTARNHNMIGLMPDGSTRHSLRGKPVHPMVGAGTLAEYSLVRESQAVKIPGDVPLDLACLAGCGVTTGVGAVFNAARVAPGDSVAVLGCGGVGLNVVQAARVAGAARILAVDTQAAKLELAHDLGATDLVLVGPEERASARILALVPAGVDFAFEVVGSPALVSEAFLATHKGGTTVMVGSPSPGTVLSLDARHLLIDRRVVGTVGGGNVPQRDIPRIMELVRAGRLDLAKLVSQRIPLERVQEAFEALEEGKLARTVVVF